MSALESAFPATVAVRDHPVRELDEARRKMEEWSEQLRLMRDLMQRGDVSDADKMTLGLEMATAKACLMACANIITACEERMREQSRRLEDRWGWLL